MTLKVVDPNDTEYISYEMAEGLDKEHVLVGYDSYEEPGRRVIIYERHQSLQDWLQQHQVVIGGRLNQELISIIWYFCNQYLLFIFFI